MVNGPRGQTHTHLNSKALSRPPPPTSCLAGLVLRTPIYSSWANEVPGRLYLRTRLSCGRGQLRPSVSLRAPTALNACAKASQSQCMVHNGQSKPQERVTIGGPSVEAAGKVLLSGSVCSTAPVSSALLGATPVGVWPVPSGWSVRCDLAYGCVLRDTSPCCLTGMAEVQHTANKEKNKN